MLLFNVNRKYKVYNARNFSSIPRIDAVPREYRESLAAVAAVFPFRVNNHVVDALIDWDRVPHDPIFRMTFPHPEMLAREDLERIRQLQQNPSQAALLKKTVREIQEKHNPHPAAQVEKNVPVENGVEFGGCSISTMRRCFSFPPRARPAMPIAPTAFAGCSLSAWRI